MTFLMRFFSILLLAAVAGCGPTPDLDSSKPAATGPAPLRVIIRTAPATFWGKPWGMAGLELEIAELFAARLKRPLEILSISEDRVIVDTLTARLADIAVASLPELSLWADRLVFSEALIDSRYVLVYRDNVPDLENLPLGAVALAANESAYAFAREHIEFINRIRPYPEFDAYQLMRKVDAGTVPMVLTQASKFELIRSAHPNLKATASIGGDIAMGWAIDKRGDRALIAEANQLLTRLRNSGDLAELMEKHLPGEPLPIVDALTFDRHIEDRLSLYWPHFVDAGAQSDQDPVLLAAVAYQESHWRRRAKSPTGVRGVMMLTLTTAKEMGVTNRLDARSSIIGGAGYLRKLRDRLPGSILEPDRTYMALAAYNLGYGHLTDVRKLTEKLGGDPNRWDDVRETLPLKADKAYYPATKYGYARGWEPVAYVDNIRNYYNALLTRNSRVQALAMTDTAQGSQ